MKQIKDPIYGYIKIPCELMRDVVDTAEFQRLRRIVQTSYAPLYPSATHNRFVHSLGVYHLGCIAVESIKSSLSDEDQRRMSRWIDLFKLACLLHDVGHAPFSHTGEEFYLDNRKYGSIHARLASVIGKECLEDEFAENVKTKSAAKPHEIMSAIVGIRLLESSFAEGEVGVQEKEFFARAICGYKYNSRVGEDGFKNELITLLNSSIIDVDKLDYLIRDSYLIGYQTVSIDYRRLLEGVCVRRMPTGSSYKLEFPKKSVSVFENVVYAHDLERKWIQNHPIVKYEMFLLKEAMREVVEKLKEINVKLFCEEALGDAGVKINGELKIRYMSDDDLIFLMKNFGGKSAHMYMHRNEWSKGIWKSDAEFRALFGGEWSQEGLKKFKMEVSSLLKYLQIDEDGCINGRTLEVLQEGLRSYQSENCDAYAENTKNLTLHVKLCEVLKKFAEEHGNMPFEYVIVRGKGFKSGFEKEALGHIRIRLGIGSRPLKLKDVIPLLKVNGNELDELPFFHVFVPMGSYLTGQEASDVSRSNLATDFVKALQKYTSDELANEDC